MIRNRKNETALRKGKQTGWNYVETELPYWEPDRKRDKWRRMRERWREIVIDQVIKEEDLYKGMKRKHGIQWNGGACSGLTPV